MSAAAVLAVIVAAGEAHTPLTDALIGAAKEAVGAAASVHVTETASQTDRVVLRVEAAMDALAAVSLVWDDDQHLRAHTRLHVAKSDRWTNRDMAFEPADRPLERGRALGFTIASMLPEAGADIEITLPDSFVRREVLTTHAVQVTLMGAGLAGPVGVGGAVAGEVMMTDSLAVRAGLVFRQGTLQSATASFEGTIWFGAVAAGACWWLLAPSPDNRFGVGLRADLMAVRVEIIPEPEGVARQGAFFPGADLMAQATARVAAGVDLVVGVGGDTVFGKTTLLVARSSDTIQITPGLRPWQAVAEAGMRFRF